MNSEDGAEISSSETEMTSAFCNSKSNIFLKHSAIFLSYLEMFESRFYSYADFKFDLFRKLLITWVQISIFNRKLLLKQLNLWKIRK